MMRRRWMMIDVKVEDDQVMVDGDCAVKMKEGNST